MDEREEILANALNKLNMIKETTHPSLVSYKNSNLPVRFRPPTTSEFKTAVPQNCIGNKQYEHSDSVLQYKILKSDAKLVQSVLEANGMLSIMIHVKDL